jgi:hypothetical protein
MKPPTALTEQGGERSALSRTILLSSKSFELTMANAYADPSVMLCSTNPTEGLARIQLDCLPGFPELQLSVRYRVEATSFPNWFQFL